MQATATVRSRMPSNRRVLPTWRTSTDEVRGDRARTVRRMSAVVMWVVWAVLALAAGALVVEWLWHAWRD